ncbi:hypothetical protein [Paraburkholderia metrosideri]|uniref:Uncharacterized protein n=1 Tax=Paraburkholderia metrosideri TaxID=580937 RepID=A0ABN7HXE5_9BURK|nr:hypothetical protein [Paraburkholderia metrosideri]CAD6539183.1 hypothetical protein LMG28140_03343 [Paraburkholderia metrosideri]
MAKYVASDTAFPTIGEIIAFLAVRSGLVLTDGNDPAYDHLKQFVREQKGKDFSLLDEILDVLQARLEDDIAPPGLGDLCFEAFRRFLDVYKSLILNSRASIWGRSRFVEEKLVPEFIIPYAGWWLKLLNREPFDFVDVVELLRSESPLKVAFHYPLHHAGKSWLDLAEIYSGKSETYADKPTDHDIDDNKKLVRKWGAGKATPSLETCFELLDALGQGQYSGIVFWVWIGRFLQKIDKQYRHLIADAIERDAPPPTPSQFAMTLTEESDMLARKEISADGVYYLRCLTTLLFYNKHRIMGDKARAEQLLAIVKEKTYGVPVVGYYITWLEARFHLYCRDISKALAGYEEAFYQGMYGDSQAETRILPEWAAIAQKAGDKAALKRIDSRMKLLRIYPADMSADEVAELRVKAFDDNFGAGVCFIESFLS